MVTLAAGTGYTTMGSPWSATAAKTVKVINDNLVEADETVVVTLASGTGYNVAVRSKAVLRNKLLFLNSALANQEVYETIEAAARLCY